MNRTVFLCILWILGLAVAPLRAPQYNEAVEVVVDDLQATEYGVSLTLRASQSDEELHMLIGLTEGQAIARALRSVKTPRPMTHDLLKTILDRTGWRVQKVLIREYVKNPEGGTFLADLVLERNGDTAVVDARPSDAMAVAVRANAKIYVNPQVFEIVRQQEQEQGPLEGEPSQEDTIHL